ncbi:Metallo-dependent phosphatase, partial [Setomelanomma holmii]
PSPLTLFVRDPCLFIASYLYTYRPPISPPPLSSKRIRIVCISDTHNLQPDVPDGDVLIHAGDLTVNGTFSELRGQIDWLKSLPPKCKIAVAGNHDVCLNEAHMSRQRERERERERERARGKIGKIVAVRNEESDWGLVMYLQNATSTISLPHKNRTLRIYASPMTPRYGNWAFQYTPEKDIWRGVVPEKTHVPVTHGPPLAHLDFTDTYRAGCPHLLREMWRVKPRLHVFGHVHRAKGVEVLDWGWVQRGYD